MTLQRCASKRRSRQRRANVTGYLGEDERSIAAFRRQGGSCIVESGAELGEYLALGNVGSAQLRAGELEAAIESLRNGGGWPTSN